MTRRSKHAARGAAPAARTRRPWLVAVIVAGVALAALLWMRRSTVQRDSSPAASTRGADAGRYVGSAACASCHSAEASAWRGSQHERAMQQANERTVLGDFADARFSYAGTTSRFYRREGRYFVTTDGPDGMLHEYEVAYTFGVAPLQQYLIVFPDGRLQPLSIAWDARPKSAGGQRWFHLYPGQHITHDDPLHWTAPSQNWNFMCADCHSTDLRRNYDVARDRFATTWSEISVGCETCHGPGSNHVRWAKQRRSWLGWMSRDDGLVVRFEGGGSWTIDPASSNARRSAPSASPAELETCAPCHARRAQIGEGHLPGTPVLDDYVVSLLDPGLYEADGQMRDEVYNYGSFLQSRMHAAGVSCGNCHEPHGLTLRAAGNAVCAQCHATSRYDAPAHHHHAESSAAARCVSCHMPERTYMVVDRRHDHGFRIPRPDLSVALGTPNACNDCHKDQSAAWAAHAVDGWYGRVRKGFQDFAPALAAVRAERPDGARLLRRLVANGSQPAIARATACAALAPYLTDSIAAELEGALRDPDPLVRLGALRGLDGLPVEQRWAFAGALLGDSIRAVRLEATSFLAEVPASDLAPEARAAMDRAMAEYIAAQEVNADRPDAHLNLGLMYAQRGDPSRAEAEYRSALRLDRRFVPGYVNLADLYRSEGRDADGERVLREALAVAPDDASVHHSLGLLLVREKRLPEALTWLERAARERPEVARYGYVYGVALSSAGRADEALRTLEAAYRRHPADRSILEALVGVARDVGDAHRARAYAEKLRSL